MTYQRRCSCLSWSAFDRTSCLAVLADLDRADSLQCGARPAAAVCRDPLGPIAVDEPDLPEPGVRLEPGIARLLAPVPLRVRGTPEERGERIVESAEGLLLGGERVHTLPAWVSLANVLKLGRLHPVGHGCLPHTPRLATLLERGVVQVAVVVHQLHRAPLLRARRVGADT